MPDIVHGAIESLKLLQVSGLGMLIRNPARDYPLGAIDRRRSPDYPFVTCKNWLQEKYLIIWET